MHPVWLAGMGGLVAALLLTSTYEPRVSALYRSLYNVRWFCEPSLPLVLPLALPSSRWNPYGKVLGTVSSTAVTYRVTAVGANATELALSRTHQRCPENATCTLTDAQSWNVVPSVTLHRVAGRNSTVVVPLPAAADNVSLAHWTGITTLLWAAPSQAAYVDRQLWALVLDDMPDLQRVSSAGSGPVDDQPMLDVPTSLDLVQLTPRVPLNRTLVTDYGAPLVMTRGSLTFALVQPVCVTRGPLVGVAGDVMYLGRVGPGQTCGGYLLAVFGAVQHCIDMATGQQLCHQCSLNQCLSYQV